MFKFLTPLLQPGTGGKRFTFAIFYLLLIAPPRAFDIKHNQVRMKGELANLPTFMIAAIELVVRVAIILLLATGIESQFGDDNYETYRLDIFFSVVVVLGSLHSVSYYLAFAWMAERFTSKTTNKFYRLARNTCYSALPGFAAIIPVLILRWDQELPPYNDGFALQLYLWTTAAMFVIGVIESLFVPHKPIDVVSQEKVEAQA